MRTQISQADETQLRPVTEVERKFVVDDDAAFPGLEDVAPSLSVGSVETVDLDAVYYDTNDYRLARSGASLRLRLGGADAGWHLKLPGPAADARIELRLPAPQVDLEALLAEPPAVPEELRDLTLSRTGGRALKPAVRITTRRTRTVLVDPESRPFAEVDLDEVGAFVNGRLEPHDRWKELEIELLEGNPHEFAEISRNLERHGGRPASYRSKFARALGAAAKSPLVADPRLAKSPSDSVGRVFAKRWHDLVLELIARDVGVRLGEVEAVHRMRVAIRRLRSALKTFTPILDEESAIGFEGELAWLGNALGALRDCDVMKSHLESMLDALPPGEVLGPVREQLASHFAESRRAAFANSLEAMRSERYLSLLSVLRAVSVAPPLRPKANRSIKTAASVAASTRVPTRRSVGPGRRDPKARAELRCTRSARRQRACAMPPRLSSRCWVRRAG